MATTDEVDRIVKAVMVELRHLAPAPVSQAVAKAAAIASEKPPENGDLVIESRLVTMSEILGQLTGKRRLLVQQTALVTPAVTDELRRRGVTLVRGSAAAVKQSSLPAVLVISARTKQSAETAIRLLEQEGATVRHEQSDCMIASSDMLAEAVRGGKTLGLLWTRLTAMGLCLANRHQGVRAVQAADVAGTAAAIEVVGANALVLDPAAGTEYQRIQILRDFCRGGVRRCPESLTSRLG